MAGHAPPKHRSSDHDPLFTVPRWRATLRVLDVDDIKPLPLVLCAPPFVERLIGQSDGSLWIMYSSGMSTT